MCLFVFLLCGVVKLVCVVSCCLVCHRVCCVCCSYVFACFVCDSLCDVVWFMFVRFVFVCACVFGV